LKLTIEQLRKWLEQFPPDATVYAYEGFDGIGIGVRSADGEYLDFIEAGE
jgi:hypothetical protein